MMSDGSLAEKYPVMRGFPFNCDFQCVVDRTVSRTYLAAAKRVLMPAVDLVMGELRVRSDPDLIAAVVSAVAALGRISIVEAFEPELSGDVACDDSQLVSMMRVEWAEMCVRERLVDIETPRGALVMFGVAMSDLWRVHSVVSMCTATTLLDEYPAAMSGVKAVRVGNLLVENPKGAFVTTMSAEQLSAPLLPAGAYRSVLDFVGCVHVVDGETALLSVENLIVSSGDLGYGLISRELLLSWVWAVISGSGHFSGFCYQLLVPPWQRYGVCRRLGCLPSLAELRWCVADDQIRDWSTVKATYEVADVVHVKTPGNPCPELWTLDQGVRVGMDVQSRVAGVDYFAKGLVDAFVTKHRQPFGKTLVTQPVDPAFEGFTVPPARGAGRALVDVATMQYGALGEQVSPRAEADFGNVDVAGAGRARSRRSSMSRADLRRADKLQDRFEDGPVVAESYFRRSKSRFKRHLRRPSLVEAEGHSYHIFEGFPSGGGVGTGPWQFDESFDVPGWVSYIASFRADSTHNLAFEAPGESVSGGVCHDVRMDCTGYGAMDFGDCKVPTEKTVLWFSRSVKFYLDAREDVDLRISIPMTGVAYALGMDMRRYLRVPGYTVVARSFDVVRGVGDVRVDVRVRGGAKAGCKLSTGRAFVPSGRHRLRVAGLASAAPVRLMLKSEPVHAVRSFTVCGMRLKSRSRDYVSVLFDITNADMFVDMQIGGTVVISIVQVVDVSAYDVALAADAELQLEMKRDARKAGVRHVCETHDCDECFSSD